GPGDLYTSIICNLVVNSIQSAIRNSKAMCVFVLNLMTRFGQTNNFTASDHIKELEKYLGKGAIDVCLINKTRKFPKGVLKKYREEKAYPVEDDLKNGDGVKTVRRSFVSRRVFGKPKSDKLTRSLIRHDPDRLAKAIVSLL
ncbi:MAG: 2-phospho-L-lactate transferase CofD family protein, partial [Patescibacteria group bacterium]